MVEEDEPEEEWEGFVDSGCCSLLLSEETLQILERQELDREEEGESGKMNW